MIPRAIVHIFEGKEAEEDDETLFDVRVSYIEIYNEEIRDLLGDDVTKKLEIKVINLNDELFQNYHCDCIYFENNFQDINVSYHLQTLFNWINDLLI